jgi:hypothetical protein
LKLRPAYLLAIIQGWESALKADIELSWAQIADFIRVVLAHPDASPFPAEGGDYYDDRDFRPAKRVAVGLLVELVKVRDSRAVPEESLGNFAKLLIESADDETAWTAYDAHEPGEGAWDPLTMSLNWQWPERLRGLIYLATYATDAPWKQSAKAAVERDLARRDRHGAGRAILGENLARLFNELPDWLASHVDDFFGSEDNFSVAQQITLTTAIATHHYHRHLFDLLRGSMMAAVGLNGEIARGWRSRSDPIQQIGEWVIDALVYGDKTVDDALVRAFFATVSPGLRGGSLGSIAWSFFRADKVDDPIRDRFADLWDTRIQHVKDHPEDHAELLGFYWCAKGGKFEINWWLPRLKSALELEPGIARERYMIGKELAQASAVDPATALEVLRLLLAGRHDGGMVSSDLMRNAAPVIIANAMAAGDSDLKTAAVAYMNELGARGNLHLNAAVNAVLDGSIGPDGVED